MKDLNCSKCDDVVEVEKDVAKVTCSYCCATMGLKKDQSFEYTIVYLYLWGRHGIDCQIFDIKCKQCDSLYELCICLIDKYKNTVMNAAMHLLAVTPSFQVAQA